MVLISLIGPYMFFMRYIYIDPETLVTPASSKKQDDSSWTTEAILSVLSGVLGIILCILLLTAFLIRRKWNKDKEKNKSII